MRLVSYIRVSTLRQGESGLGLEAQQDAVARYARSTGGEVIEEFREVESGGKDDRPQLTMALRTCRRIGATLVVAKLDRLARSVHFTSSVLRAGVEIVCCDMPQANRLTLHIIAAVAEHERELISMRTKVALAAAKARGVKLGSPRNLTPAAAALGSPAGVVARRAKADDFAARVRVYIEDCGWSELPLVTVAERLNAAGALTARGVGGGWTATAVRRVMSRSLS